MSRKKLQIGAVGLGRGSTAIEIAQKFASKVNIAAICDINKEKADNCASRFGINNVYYDYEEMLKDKSLDAIYVATPIPSHAKHCIQAFEAGKHVLSEVTCLTDLRDAELMIKAQEKSGKIYMLAENYCYLKAWDMVMKMVKAGLFGEIYYAEGDYLMNFHQRAGFPYVHD